MFSHAKLFKSDIKIWPFTQFNLSLHRFTACFRTFRTKPYPFLRVKTMKKLFHKTFKQSQIPTFQKEDGAHRQTRRRSKEDKLYRSTPLPAKGMGIKKAGKRKRSARILRKSTRPIFSGQRLWAGWNDRRRDGRSHLSS